MCVCVCVCVCVCIHESGKLFRITLFRLGIPFYRLKKKTLRDLMLLINFYSVPQNR